MLTKEDILTRGAPRIEGLDVPEWNGRVFVRAMSGAERDAYEREQFERRDAKAELVNFRARLLVRTVCDEAGRLTFSVDDADQLGKLDAGILNRLFELAARLNGLDKAAEEQARKN